MSVANLPSVIAGRYRVIRELGRGGMGAVYLVEHVHTGEQLALKVLLAQEALHADAIERFKREARAPARIRSEHVVRVTDADVAPELGGAPFMVMEALQGKDLEAVVKERGKLPPAEVAWILNQVGSALEKAHAIGIVHRDLKPENIFLHTRDDGSSIIKILDFGISKIREKDGDAVAAAGLTQTGAVMGTPLYMSPEQARGNTANLVGPQTDIWALGLVTLRLLTGDIYWYGIDTLADLLIKIMIDPLPPPSVRWPLLGVNIDAWFAKSCERDLSRRFTSVAEQVRSFAITVNAAPLTASGVSTTNPMFGGTMVLGASSPHHTGPHIQTNVHGSQGQAQPTGPQLPQPLLSTPNPIRSASHQTGPSPMMGTTPPNAEPPLAQTGPSSQSQPFIHLQSTTSGAGAMVRPSTTMTDVPSPGRSGKLAFVLAPLGLLILVGVIGAAVYVPRWRSSHALGSATPVATDSVPTPTPSASASVSVVATVTAPTASQAPSSSPPPPTATTTVADVKPTAAKPPPTTPPIKPTPSAAVVKPTPSASKFNPEAP